MNIAVLPQLFNDTPAAPTRANVTVYGGAYMSQKWTDMWRAELENHLPADGKHYVAAASHGTLAARKHAAQGGADALILLCPPHGGPESARCIQNNMARDAWTALTPLGMWNTFFRLSPFARICGSALVNDDIWREAHLDMMMNFGREVIQKIRDIATFDHDEVHARINIPTLIVTGDRDAVVPPDDSAKIVRGIPHATHMRVAGSHLFFFEQTDLFQDIARHFEGVWDMDNTRVQ